MGGSRQKRSQSNNQNKYIIALLCIFVISLLGQSHLRMIDINQNYFITYIDQLNQGSSTSIASSTTSNTAEKYIFNNNNIDQDVERKETIKIDIKANDGSENSGTKALNQLNNTLGNEKETQKIQPIVNNVDTNARNEIGKNSKKEKERPTINYEIISKQDKDYQLSHHNFDTLTCDNNIRQATSSKFTKKGVFDFTVQISTSYKILYMGDSVGIQFSQSLQEVSSASTTMTTNTAGSTTSDSNRKVLRYSWGNLHEGIHIANPIRGGGAIAGWRITGMFREDMKDEYGKMPNYYGGGWMNYDVKNLKRALAYMNMTDLKNEVERTSCAIKVADTATASNETQKEQNSNEKDDEECREEDFDVVIHQFPFGWLQKPVSDKITFESIHEAVKSSRRYFGAKTVILQTIPVNNNVIDMSEELDLINSRIINFTKTVRENPENYLTFHNDEGNEEHVDNVLVLDFGRLSLELFAHNAAALNLIKIRPGEIDEAIENNSIMTLLNPLLSHRTMCCNKEYGQIIGFTCSRNRHSTRGSVKDCFKTRYSRDGMHWCMDEIGGRMNGGIACLLKCVDEKDKSFSMNDCEHQCNKRFMSLNSFLL